MEQLDAAAVPWEDRPGEAGSAGDPPPGPAQPPTGDPRVDEAVSRLSELPGLPVAEHPAVFEDVHRRLAETLGELDPPAAGR